MTLKTVLLLAIFFCIAVAAHAQTEVESPAAQADRIIQQALAERNPDKRKVAVIALSLEGARNNVIALLDAALDDEDVQVRLAACASLSALKDRRSIPPLQKALNDSVPEVGFAAAQALWQFEHPAGREVLVAVLVGERKTSSGYISKQKRDAMRTMKSPGGLFKLALKRGVGFVPLPGLGTGISSLQALLKDSISGRAIAALQLASDDSPDTLEILRDALADKDWSVRAAAVHSIALRNRPELRKDIEPLFADKKDEVRLRAAAAYLRLESIDKEKRPRRPHTHRK